MSEQRKAVIKNADMSDSMQQDAVDIASKALSEYSIEKDVAAYIKKEFDRKHGPTWYVQACDSGSEFRKLRYPRNKAFHLLLPWTSRNISV